MGNVEGVGASNTFKIVRWDLGKPDRGEPGRKEPCTRATPRPPGSHARHRSAFTTVRSHNRQWQIEGSTPPVVVKLFFWNGLLAVSCEVWRTAERRRGDGSAGVPWDSQDPREALDSGALSTWVLRAAWACSDSFDAILTHYRGAVNQISRVLAENRQGRTIRPSSLRSPRGGGRSPPTGGGTPAAGGRFRPAGAK